jgi:glycerol-3-phosphate dehydrogenase (NAD(P)+)
MTPRDFWRNSKVAVIGAGSWGTVLAELCSRNCRDVRLWARDEEVVRAINATRVNAEYWPELKLPGNVHAMTSIERVFEDGVQAVIWALPSSRARQGARDLAPRFRGDEILLHATKGTEEGTLKRISEVLREELPCPRIGVLSGPNLADEIARGEPAATVVASRFPEVIDAGAYLLSGERFRVYTATDVVGVEWAGTLKNILAIAAGALDAMKLGWNARAMLITRGLAEIVRFGTAMGAKLAAILGDLGSTAEGARTTVSVWEFAKAHGISMPITESVYHLLQGDRSVQEALRELMLRPAVSESQAAPRRPSDR